MSEIIDRAVVEPISFADPAVQRCPFGAYSALQDDTPVYLDPLTGNYVLTRYDDVRRALLNVRALSNRTGLGGMRSNPAVDAIFDARGWRPMNTLGSADAPEHRRHRTLVDKAFATTQVEMMGPRIQQIVDGLIDSWIDKPEVELLSEFAIKLPMIVIAEQLSIAPEDMDRFKMWSDISVETQDPTMTPEREIEVVTELTVMQQYIAAAMARLRQQPDGSLLSNLVHAEVDGDRLDMGVMQNIVQQLLVAGNETTTMTLAACVKMLINDPARAATLHADPDKVRNFVEETLRVVSPVQTLFRLAKEDMEISGTKIPQGAMVEVRYGAANRDPAMYPEPGCLDMESSNASSHLAFGAGPHLCIGNQLARGELRIAVQTLVDRLVNIRLSSRHDALAYTPLYISYGLTKLWMTFDKR